MGKTIGAALGSGKIGENSRIPGGNKRTKQKKRKKDLEKLHRNVLEAKNNLHRDPGKSKTSLSKVLTNFADKRQRNDATTHALTKKNGRINPRTICNRLLPEPIVGIYRNGAKGRQARRVGDRMAGTNIARLEDDVLKLLDGDETNPKWSGDRGGKQLKKRDRSKESFDSNDTIESAPFVTNNPFHAKTEGGSKWINRKKGTIIGLGEKVARPKEQAISQREKACKRRLFEPDGETDENGFGIIDRSEIMNDIRFPPARRIAVDYSVFENHVKNYTLPDDGKTKQKVDWRKIKTNFWGWSPEICYERLCAKICSENFEKQLSLGPDPIVKNREALVEFYAHTRHNASWDGKTNKRSKRRATNCPKQSPLADFSSPLTFAETTAESDRDSANSPSAVKVGSWHPNNSPRISSDAIPYEDTNEIEYSRGVEKTEDVEINENVARRSKKSRLHEENSAVDKVVPTINSAGLFLKALREDNSSKKWKKSKNTFAAQVAAAAADYRRNNKFNNNLHGDINIENLQRNTKHIPSILRRSRQVENIEDDKVDSYENIHSKDYPMTNDSDSISTPSSISDLAEATVRSKEKFTRKRSKPEQQNIEPELSSGYSNDAEIFNATQRASPVFDARYVEQVEDPVTRIPQMRGRRKSFVAFDIDEPPRKVHASQPNNHDPPFRFSRTKKNSMVYNVNHKTVSRTDKEARAASQQMPGTSGINQRATNKRSKIFNPSCPGNASHSRKPVAVFKPTQDPTENDITKMSNAVKNLYVYNHSQKRRISPGHSQRYKTNENTVHQPILDTQPAKYLAFDDGKDTGRMPIYKNGLHSTEQCLAENPEVVDIINVEDGDEKSKEQQKNNHYHIYYFNCYPGQAKLGLPSPHSPHRIANNAVTTALRSTSNNVRNMSHREPLVSAQIKYPPSCVNTNINKSSRDNENLSKRVQLADGTTGIFVPESTSIDTNRAFKMEKNFQSNNSREVAQFPFDVPHPPAHSQLRAFSNIETNAAPSHRSSSNNFSRNVGNIADCETLSSARLPSQSMRNVNKNLNGGFTENGSLVKRIQLADGTIGIFVPESGHTMMHNNNERVNYDSMRTAEMSFN